MLAVIAVVTWQFLFPAPTVLDEQADYGPSPQLVEPLKTLVPIVRPAKAVGWPAGEIPTPAGDLEINAFVGGLDHPRWLYVLPNGDVLVAESNAPEGSGLCSEFKKFAAALVLNFSGARTPSADRITLHRDTDGDGAADESHVFAAGLHSPFGMALIGDHLYIANADALLRFPYQQGQTALTESPETIVRLPSGMNHHWTKNILASTDNRSLFI
ncbi:MAG: sorbosone dehydrogenase family protein, partial [Gammaproteobacteria bacterium]|nr:sorbosone dehydrogenase family protein [Gammaproteobacteria bacterium]